MAFFSKQWCDTYDPGGIPWDFDILKVANTLGENEKINVICEGYGFESIMKDDSGNVFLYMQNDSNRDLKEWVHIEKLDEYYVPYINSQKNKTV